MKPRYLNIQTGEVVTPEQIKANNPECITTQRDNLNYCLFVAGYGELRY